MSLSPELPPRTSPPPSAASLPQSQLAALLSEAYKELEAQRVETALLRDRALKAEKLVKTLSTVRAQSTSTPAASSATTTVNGPSPSSSSPTNVPPVAPATTSSSSTGASPPSPQMATDDAIRLVLEYEERATRAEQERDDAVARRTALCDYWTQLSSYLGELDQIGLDARLGFDRLTKDGTGSFKIPLIPDLESPRSNGHKFPRPANQFPTLPPHPHPTSMRRVRTPSFDSFNAPPPSKRPRGEYMEATHPYIPPNPTHPYSHLHPHPLPPPPPPPHYQAHGPPQSQHSSARMIFPPGPSSHHVVTGPSSSRAPAHPPHPDQLPSTNHGQNHVQRRPRPLSRTGTHPVTRKSTSPDRSSEASMSVDEMILEIADDKQVILPHPTSAQAPSNGHAPPDTRSRRAEEGHHESAEYSRPPPPPQPRYPDHHQASGSSPLPLTQPAPQSHLIQTHVFAPVVTGAPTKKTKFPGSGVPPIPSSSSSAALGEGVVQGAAFPPTNDQGQRICRQCGMAGRYKDGKCVEKWGPGPMGPGTVCDRCRKKMKRVERRGTLELQQQQAHAQQQLQRQQTQPQLRPHASQPQISASSSTNPSYTPIHRTTTFSAIPSSSIGSQARFDESQSHPSSRVIHPGSPHPRPSSSMNRPSSTSALSASSQSIVAKRPPLSPTLPGIMVLNEDDTSSKVPGRGIDATASGRGSGSLAVPPARTGSRAGSSSGGGRGSRNGSRLGSKSPRVMDVEDPDADTDADAEGEGDVASEAEAEAELEAELEGIVGDGRDRGSTRKTGTHVDHEAEAEAYLLEAVDAAEANSVGSSAGSKEELT